MKHLMDVCMWGMLTWSSPRGIGVWEGKNLLSMVSWPCFLLFGRGCLISKGAHPHWSILIPEHSQPGASFPLGILIPEHPFPWESSPPDILLRCTH